MQTAAIQLVLWWPGWDTPALLTYMTSDSFTHVLSPGTHLHVVQHSYLIYSWWSLCIVEPDQLNKLLHGIARSNFWANRRKNLIKLGGAYIQ